jgi:hypothetical protein
MKLTKYSQFIFTAIVREPRLSHGHYVHYVHLLDKLFISHWVLKLRRVTCKETEVLSVGPQNRMGPELEVR